MQATAVHRFQLQALSADYGIEAIRQLMEPVRVNAVETAIIVIGVSGCAAWVAQGAC